MVPLDIAVIGANALIGNGLSMGIILHPRALTNYYLTSLGLADKVASSRKSGSFWAVRGTRALRSQSPENRASSVSWRASILVGYRLILYNLLGISDLEQT